MYRAKSAHKLEQPTGASAPSEKDSGSGLDKGDLASTSVN